jgi:acetyltransferase-like isoleucine patch superfamily enzyme
MTVLFETQHFGKIECDYETESAYFFKDDLSARIDKDGNFCHIFSGTRFTVIWPIMHIDKYTRATLQVWLPKEIAHVQF